ncbi:MAG: L-threonylcarbamoyladenylate synthase [Verrucomicrobia bacterium]|nr:MAG: L-threonylcarbamoyladenylate synthase [Verrucomicrobiota bacterium]
MQTHVFSCVEPAALTAGVEAACEVLHRGEVVALPAETVYGLAGDALNPVAAARIFEAKERPFFDPLICHLPDRGWLEAFTDIPGALRPQVERLVEAFWPGPLTLVLPKRGCVPDLVSSGLSTVAVRWSAHPMFQAVLTRFGRPLAAPSANRFGRISPTTAAHVFSELRDRIPLILDGGPAVHGVESTIVAPGEGGLRILRSGPVTREQLAFFGTIVEGVGNEVGGAPEAPGQLTSHYAPRTPLQLLEAGWEGRRQIEPGARAGLLAWRLAPPGFGASEVLSLGGDLVEAAAGLFAALRRLDEAGLDRIYAERVPEEGLGAAINDRLQRASASRVNIKTCE